MVDNVTVVSSQVGECKDFYSIYYCSILQGSNNRDDDYDYQYFLDQEN